MSEESERQPPTALKFPAGIDNRSREYAVPGDALRVCENLDVTRDGGLLSRKGLREVATGDFHSPFVHPSQRFMLVAKDGFLQRLDGDENLTTLSAVVAPVSYALLNDAVYWSDGASVGQVLPDGTAGVWGLKTPPLPIVSAVADGGLFAGAYQVAMTALHPSGLESGALDTVSVEVGEGGGIQVTTPSASGVTFALYRTPPNGAQEELRQATIVAPATTITLGVSALGRPLETLRVHPPLPGQCLIHHKGRLWVASGNVVWFTDAKSPHWLRPERGYYQFESSVRMLGATEDGIYVGLYDRVYFLQGNDPFDMTQRPASSVGTAAGTGTEIPYDVFIGDNSLPAKQAAWLDTDGFMVIGKAGGVVIRPAQNLYSAGSVERGAIAYRVYEGLRQLVSVLSTSALRSMQATDVAVADVFAHGVVLN
jgi:hypothetical protein